MKRSKKLIDKRYQLKTAFSVMMISVLSFLLLIGMLLWVIVRTDQGIITDTADRLDQSVAKQDHLINSVLTYSRLIKNSQFEFSAQEAQRDHQQSMGVIRENIELLKSSTRRNRLLLVIVVALTLFQGGLTFWFLIRLTHRVSGPMLVMSRYLDQYRRGDPIAFRELRDKDEFKEFHRDLSEFMHSLQMQRIGKADEGVNASPRSRRRKTSTAKKNGVS